MASGAAYIALYQLVFKPHYWEKTLHGLNLLTQTATQTMKAISQELVAISGKKSQELKAIKDEAVVGGERPQVFKVPEYLMDREPGRLAAAPSPYNDVPVPAEQLVDMATSELIAASSSSDNAPNLISRLPI